MNSDHSIISNLHDQAMERADRAEFAAKEGRLQDAQKDYLAAFEFDRAAAMLLVNSFQEEPTRSVLFRSAACLLLNLPYPETGHWRQAEQMVAFGLSGTPPEEVALELREIWHELAEHLSSTAA